MCQLCFERPSHIFLALVPELVEKAQQNVESEMKILARFEAAGYPEDIARQRSVVDNLQDELRQLQNLQQHGANQEILR